MFAWKVTFLEQNDYTNSLIQAHLCGDSLFSLAITIFNILFSKIIKVAIKGSVLPPPNENKAVPNLHCLLNQLVYS